jgi:hypothetical protein
MPVPDLIEQTCRTGHHERGPWHKQPGRGAKQGAITGPHEATLSLLERSIFLIKQVSSDSEPYRAAAGISFAWRWSEFCDVAVPL